MNAEEKRLAKADKSRMWRLANPDRVKMHNQRARERRKGDPERLQRRRECNERSRRKHREQLNAKNREAYRTRPEVRERGRRWQSAHPVELREASLRWEAANTEKRRIYRHRSNKKASEGLNDSYVRQTLSVGTGVPTGEWPQELVDLQRENLKLKRGLKK